MEYREFVVPLDSEIFDRLGVSPELVEDDPTVRSFRLTSPAGDDVRISYDVPGRSFRLQVSSGNVMRLDLLGESATRLSVGAEGGDFRIRVKIESADLAGELDVSVGSEIVARDRILMI